MCVNIHANIPAYIHACMHACMHTYIHSYIHTYIQIHVDIYPYLYICTPSTRAWRCNAGVLPLLPTKGLETLAGADILARCMSICQARAIKDLHFTILSEGFRAPFKGTRVDMTRVDLTMVDMTGVDMTGGDIMQV